MSQGLKVHIIEQGDDLHLALHGPLDENCVLPEFHDEIRGRAVLDLEHLTMINSLGTRRWLNWIKSLRARGGIVLQRCSSPFIAQVNILHGFVPAGVTIASFQVPYHCPQCAHEDFMLFQVGKDAQAPETTKCTACQAESELDVVRAKYFGFLQKKSA